MAELWTPDFMDHEDSCRLLHREGQSENCLEEGLPLHCCVLYSTAVFLEFLSHGSFPPVGLVVAC